MRAQKREWRVTWLASTDKWIKAAWANECSKEHTSTKKIAGEVMAEIKVDVEFGMETKR